MSPDIHALPYQPQDLISVTRSNNSDVTSSFIPPVVTHYPKNPNPLSTRSSPLPPPLSSSSYFCYRPLHSTTTLSTTYTQLPPRFSLPPNRTQSATTPSPCPNCRQRVKPPKSPQSGSVARRGLKIGYPAAFAPSMAHHPIPRYTPRRTLRYTPRAAPAFTTYNGSSPLILRRTHTALEVETAVATAGPLLADEEVLFFSPSAVKTPGGSSSKSGPTVSQPALSPPHRAVVTLMRLYMDPQQLSHPKEAQVIISKKGGLRPG
ncbi:unnamed protein product [Pieris brassicae]|uniref:Uncharacterized protein n=1 Tax=Pieris brassicae TaxID=7116 RepID=A0A9P0TNG5_PIEBR|nr:unnamed protein product [Pieris brassicae]